MEKLKKIRLDNKNTASRAPASSQADKDSAGDSFGAVRRAIFNVSLVHPDVSIYTQAEPVRGGELPWKKQGIKRGQWLRANRDIISCNKIPHKPAGAVSALGHEEHDAYFRDIQERARVFIHTRTSALKAAQGAVSIEDVLVMLQTIFEFDITEFMHLNELEELISDLCSCLDDKSAYDNGAQTDQAVLRALFEINKAFKEWEKERRESYDEYAVRMWSVSLGFENLERFPRFTGGERERMDSRFRELQIKEMRRRGFTDAQIKRHFRRAQDGASSV